MTVPDGAGLGELRFLYVGVDDTAVAVAQWVDGGAAVLRWRFQHFGADVAGLEVGSGPLVLLADHRPTGSVLPIWSVDDLRSSMTSLTAAGWQVSGPMGTPEGDAAVASSRSPDPTPWTVPTPMAPTPTECAEGPNRRTPTVSRRGPGRRAA